MKITVHVMDTANGVSGADVQVALAKDTGDGWHEVARGRTLGDGRLVVAQGPHLTAGIYQLEFDLDEYYTLQGRIPLFPRAIVEFRLSGTINSLHLPLLISPHYVLAHRGVE